KSDRLVRERTDTMPAPALPRYVDAVIRAAASGLALIAATTWAAVELRAPAASVPRKTSTSLPLTATLSGWLLPVWLRNSDMTWLPPSWPQSLAVSTTAEACATAAETSTGSTLNVKSPRSPRKPEISKLYVPAAVSVRLMVSG